jgi:hypothetical protein
MKCEIEQESNKINRIAILFAKEGNKNHNYEKLLDYSYRMLYEIPLRYKLIEERDLSEFYCIYQDKIPPYINIFDSTKGTYYNFLRSVIWNMSHFYKLRNSKDALETQIKENIYTSSQITNDSFAYEKVDDSQFILTRVHNDRVCESNLEYNKFSSYPQIDKQRNEQLQTDFQKIINTVRIDKKEMHFENDFFNNLYKRMDSKVTRRRILLYIMIFPDLILDYYTEECSKLFSVDEELIVELLSTSRLFFTNTIDKIESEKERSAKLMMRILELKAMKKYTKYYNNIDELDRKIEKTTDYYNTALANVEKLKNRHISQRTLGKALNIKSGTMASSINYSKKILKDCCNLQ